MKFKSELDDENWVSNVKRLKCGLVRGSVITSYETRIKKTKDRLDNQSVWLIIEYEKDNEKFKTIQSHKNNQFVKIKKGMES